MSLTDQVPEVPDHVDDETLEHLGAALQKSVGGATACSPSLGGRHTAVMRGSIGSPRTSISPRGSVGSGGGGRRRTFGRQRTFSISPSSSGLNVIHVQPAPEAGRKSSVETQGFKALLRRSLSYSAARRGSGSGDDMPMLPGSFPREQSVDSARSTGTAARRVSSESLHAKTRVSSESLHAKEASASTAEQDGCAPEHQSALSSMYTLGSFASSRRSLRIPWFHSFRRRVTGCCRHTSKNRFFQILMFGALLAALFLPDLWVLLDRPHNNDLDVVLTFVLLLFLVELVVQSVGLTQTYWGSFFFWMDLLGAVSLLLDLSFLPLGASSTAADSGTNVVILRAARIAKLGARAGRFTRLAKLLRFLPFMQEVEGSDRGTAKVISARLITSLSMRVSCLIIVMVILMPIFNLWTYPGEDWSMKSWVDILDVASSQYADSFNDQLEGFKNFYDSMAYYPYRLSALPGASLPTEIASVLPWESGRSAPARAANIIRQEGTHFVCEFNFKGPNQIDSLMNIFLLIVIMILMVGWSLMLSNFVSAQVLRPLEKLLLQVRRMASTIFQSVTDMTVTMASADEVDDDEEKEDEDVSAALDNETELLDKVVAKLAVLSQIAISQNAVDPKLMEDLGAVDRAVIRGYEGHRLGTQESMMAEPLDEEEEVQDQEALRMAQRIMVENAGLSLEVLDSDNLCPLELDRARNQAAASFIVGQLHHGIPFDPVTMQHFLESVETGYEKTSPYHNWYHAVDIAHFIYRLLFRCSTEQYLHGTERFGLLVSALCHDIGHMGVNNIFLVETAHELALRYNDKSPLENMHCARLFEIVSSPKCNVFSLLSKHQFQDVRKLCIEVILHTDNAQHFAMVKEVQMFYEVHSSIFTGLRKANEGLHAFTLTPDALEQFSQTDTRKLIAKLFLHFADISNCMKPFRICRIWAMKIMDEFFMQGDVEKKKGVTVQALNDREKVNRAFSQVGFIEFLVSPLMFAVVKVMVPLECYGEQMLSNVKKWHQLWLSETEPQPSEAEQKAVAERIAKLSSKFLARDL